MIIWIASYPKSGNTLLRGILGTYFFSEDGKFDFKYIYKIGQFPTLENFKNLALITQTINIFKSYNLAQKKLIKKIKK